MKVITHKDIVDLQVSPLTCYQWVEEMIKNKNEAMLPAKISMKPLPGVFCNVMPCIVPENWGGCKLVTRYPDRNPSLDSKLLLYKVETGDFCAIMDANWITAMRTGAVAAHSIKLLAKEDFSKIGMIGLGNTARSSLLVLAELMPEREMKIKLLKYKGQEELFVERFLNYSNLHFSYVDSYDEVVRGSDVVISAATYFSEDLCKDDAFEEGCLIVPVHTLGFTNCDLFFDKVFADDYSHVCHFKNFSKFKSFAEVTDVVNGRCHGRENFKERIIAYNIGVSMHDINFAAHLYQMMKDDNKCTEIVFDEPTDKFWI